MRILRHSHSSNRRQGAGLTSIVLLLAVLGVAGGAWYAANKAQAAADTRERNAQQRIDAEQREADREALRGASNPMADIEPGRRGGLLGPKAVDPYSRDRSHSSHPLWRKAVEESAEAFIHLEEAERLRERSDGTWREEAKEGKRKSNKVSAVKIYCAGSAEWAPLKPL